MAKSITLITQNKRMRELLAIIDHVVDTDSSVLLIGETGVGKEIFAEYLHQTSNRSLNPFMKIGLSALPADLIESELFGHEKGAFTGAGGTKKGLFEMAHKGSLFLDDIDDVPLQVQTKLLRVLESRELMRVGGVSNIPIDVRLICASKVNLKDLVEKDRFRRDLFYRINVVPIEIPALRERKEDIMLLAEHFVRKFSPDKTFTFSPKAQETLINYPWPGNVRELRNVIQRTVLFSQATIEKSDLPPEISETGESVNHTKACMNCYLNTGMNFNEIMQCLEYNLVEQTLARTGGNQSEAAKLLGLSLSTFRDKMKKSNFNCSCGKLQTCGIPQ